MVISCKFTPIFLFCDRLACRKNYIHTGRLWSRKQGTEHGLDGLSIGSFSKAHCEDLSLDRSRRRRGPSCSATQRQPLPFFLSAFLPLRLVWPAGQRHTWSSHDGPNQQRPMEVASIRVHEQGPIHGGVASAGKLHIRHMPHAPTTELRENGITGLP